MMASDQGRFHMMQPRTEYDAASIGSAAAAEWRHSLHTAVWHTAGSMIEGSPFGTD